MHSQHGMKNSLTGKNVEMANTPLFKVHYFISYLDLPHFSMHEWDLGTRLKYTQLGFVFRSRILLATFWNYRSTLRLSKMYLVKFWNVFTRQAQTCSSTNLWSVSCIHEPSKIESSLWHTVRSSDVVVMAGFSAKVNSATSARNRALKLPIRVED